MGRVLSVVRRQQAIAWWRPCLKAVIASKRPTLAVLAAALDLDLDEPSSGLERLPEARQDLIAVLALPDAEREAALSEWIGKHLVDQGHRLLVPEQRRIGVLAYVRDGERPPRQTKPVGAKVGVRVSDETAEQLRQFASERGLKDDDAAIAVLLAEIQVKVRNASKSKLAPLRNGELFVSLGADLGRGKARGS